MKHTPGPWKIVPSRFGFGIRAGLTNLCQVSALDGHEASDADARLIAAAPDLLRECVEILELLETKNLKSGSKTLDSQIVANLKDLIAKARGEK